MKELGISKDEIEQEHDRVITKPTTEPLLKDEAYIFNLKIRDRVYKIDVKWLLHLKVAVTSNLSDIELEDSLEKVAAYLHTFSDAYDEMFHTLAEEELDYEIWYKDVYSKSEAILLSCFAEEVKLGSRSKTHSVPSKIQIESMVVNNNTEEYKRRKNKLNDIKIRTDFLHREFDILKIRGSHLQTLVGKRKINRTLD